MSSSYDLKETLMNLGIKKAFKPEAEFSKMIESGRPYIGQVIQKATINVNQFGIEAAAATLVTMEGATGPADKQPIQFIADHPFAYVLADSTSDIILFAGVYNGK